MDYSFNLIDAFYAIEIWHEMVYDRKYPNIRVLKQYGTNKILDDLINSSNIDAYHSFDDNIFGIDGDMHASIEYRSADDDLALLQLHTHCQAEGYGSLKSTVKNNDCMIFRHNYNRENFFEIFIFNGLHYKEPAIGQLFKNGAFDDNLKQFLV